MGRWEVGHSRVSRGVLETELGLQKREREWQLDQGQECKAGYQTSSLGSCALDGELCALGEGAEYGRAKVGVVNKTRPIQDKEREMGNPRLGEYKTSSVNTRE